MSFFGGKRKARIVKVSDDDEGAVEASPQNGEDTERTEPFSPSLGSKSGRKPLRQSGLRKSFNTADVKSLDDGQSGSNVDEEEDDGPAVVRPSASRVGFSKPKKRPAKPSRLSFGGERRDTDDGEGNEESTPKKVPFGQRVLENSALKKGMRVKGLPVRSVQDDEDRPRYSKEYLDELQSSTPNTPQDITSLPSMDNNEMDLDPSELDGALIVDSPAVHPLEAHTAVFSEAEIREKKERRARLAKEHDFLSVEDEDDSDRPSGKKKDDTRLKAEDEDLGEGFDDYVEDGGLSLGKRAEKERRKRNRQQMAELITAAEGNSSDSSSDSDAERRIAYEAAQTRAGMDGLKKPRKDPAEELAQVPPKITPLPDLSECLERLQMTIKGMELEIKQKTSRAEQLRAEKNEISKREVEVQALLDEAGKKYQEATGQAKLENGSATPVAGERGLDSLGTTPQRSTLDHEEEL